MPSENSPFPAAEDLRSFLEAPLAAVDQWRQVAMPLPGGLQLDMLLLLREPGAPLLCLLPAAQPRTARHNPVYHRWRWVEEFPNVNVAVMSEPTLHADENLLGGWLMHSQHDLARLVSAHLITVAQAWSIPSEWIVLYGSSMGGFEAIHIASVLRGARVIAEVPQFDMSTYNFPGALLDIEQYLLSTTWARHRVRHPEQVSILARFEAEQYAPGIRFITNPADETYTQIMDLPRWLSEQGLPRGGAVTIDVWHEERGHTPLGRAEAAPFVRQELSTLPGWVTRVESSVPLSPGTVDDPQTRIDLLRTGRGDVVEFTPTIVSAVSNPISVAILGSCVTRDAFEFADPSEFKVEVYLARTALASFLGRRSEVFDPEYDRIASNFQKRMVRSDVLKTGRNQLRSIDFDVLIYDPIDERFALAVFPDAGIATISSEFHGLAVPSSDYAAITAWSEAHFERWKAGWETFMRLLDEIGAQEKLVVHAARWAEKVEGSEEPSAQPSAIARANVWLDRAEARMREDIPAERIIRVSEALQLVDAEHRWGISPFHYVEGYYHDFLERLRHCVPQSGSDPENVGL